MSAGWAVCGSALMPHSCEIKAPGPTAAEEKPDLRQLWRNPEGRRVNMSAAPGRVGSENTLGTKSTEEEELGLRRATDTNTDRQTQTQTDRQTDRLPQCRVGL